MGIYISGKGEGWRHIIQICSQHEGDSPPEFRLFAKFESFCFPDLVCVRRNMRVKSENNIVMRLIIIVSTEILVGTG